MNTQVPVHILLVEDNEPDILLTQEAFADAQVPNQLQVARDGEEALQLLRCPESVRPDVILLDINMPRKNGLELLQDLKNDPKLSSIPVVMLTTSQAEEDIRRAYALHASGYVVKPVGFDHFWQLIRAFENFWLSFVRFPAP